MIKYYAIKKVGEYMAKQFSNLTRRGKVKLVSKPLSSLRMSQSDMLDKSLIQLNEQIKATIERDSARKVAGNSDLNDVTFI